MKNYAFLAIAGVITLLLSGCNSDRQVSVLEDALNSDIQTQDTSPPAATTESRTPPVTASSNNSVAASNGDGPVMNPAGPAPVRTSQVIFPNGKEQIEVGKNYNIRWESEGIEVFNLELHENGRKRHTIAERLLASQGDYDWTPTNALLGDLDYRQYKLVMIDADTGKAHDTSDEDFILVPGQ